MSEDAPATLACASFHPSTTHVLDATERNVVVIRERDDDGTQTVVVVVLCVGIAIAPIASIIVGV